MKKILYCFANFSLLILSLLISWCSFSSEKHTELSFSDTTNKFTHDMSDFYFKNIQLLNTKWVDYHIFCSTQWWNPDIDIHSSIDLSWQDSDTISGSDFQRDIIFDLYYKDRNKPDWNNIQWNLFSKKVWEEYFIKLSNWVVDFGTWNFEWKFIKLLIDSLWDKWINYDPKFSKKIEEAYGEYLEVLKLFMYPNLFTWWEQVSYEWYPAYQTNQWILIIRDKDTVEFKFDDIQWWYDKKDYFIKWNIAGEYGKISITQDKNSTKNTEISRQKKKSNLLLDISNIENFQKNWELNLNIINFWQEGTWHLRYDIHGILQISPKLIYGSELENEIKININCTYEKNSDSWDLIVSKPDSFLLLDQILWDSFSLKSIIWDTSF